MILYKNDVNNKSFISSYYEDFFNYNWIVYIFDTQAQVFKLHLVF